MRLHPSRPFWIVLTVAAAVFTAVVVGRNLLHIWKIKRQLSALDEEARTYRAQIEADSALLERLRYDDCLEEYARERFHMQRAGEKIYLLED